MRSLLRRDAASVLALLVALTACDSRDLGGTGPAAPNTGDALLEAVHHGRLVDVYGLRRDASGTVVELAQRDVLVSPEIRDQRPPTSTLKDEEVLYDFVSSDPDTLQPRLLITREIGSPEFERAFAELDRRLREVTAARFGQDASLRPFSLVPRNAAIRLRFSQSLGIDDDFFVVRDDEGRVVGVRNTSAVQLLEIVGDPNAQNPTGAFRVVPTRVVVRDDTLILDPVLLGSEGTRYMLRNSAAGMPESPDQVGANLRIAVALDGPLAIPGVDEHDDSPWIGANNDGTRSVIRDFRSGNRNDESPFVARGFIREGEPPRLLGEIEMRLAGVEEGRGTAQVLLVFKNGAVHELDRGDVLRIVDPATGQLFAATEIVADPEDAGDPGMQVVRAHVRRVPGVERLDPRARPGYPGPGPALEAWLRENAPRMALATEYTGPRLSGGVEVSDDPKYFVRFSPSPPPDPSGAPVEPNRNISPFAEAIVRFSKPVDLDSVRPYDSFFFATRDVLDEEALDREFVRPRNIDPLRFDPDKFATPHLVAARVIDSDGSQTTIRLQPTMGFYLDEEMREAGPEAFPYVLHIVGGRDGIRDLAGNGVDFHSETRLQDFATMPFWLDVRKDPAGVPMHPDNLVGSVVRRFASDDEDPQPSLYRPDEIPIAAPSGNSSAPPPEAYPLQDLFGAAVRLEGGLLKARPTTRVTQVVDDLNQLTPPAQGSLLQFCPSAYFGSSTMASPSASARFGAGIQNPLNPYGARLQTVWREIDMSLSRLDPSDFDLDVEQMYWSPFQAGAITYDEFDRVSLFLGHSEWRPEPCVDQFSVPAMPSSGLRPTFADNYAHNRAIGTGAKTDAPPPHPAYVDRRLVIDAALAFTEPNGRNRFLPLPDFEEPYFVWRDQTAVVQGGNSGSGSDTPTTVMSPYIASPFLGGAGRYVTGPATRLTFNPGRWYNVDNYRLSRGSAETTTGGLLGAIALPLLADFWTYCDSPDLPEGYGFIATGYNGWQIALSVQGFAQPNFRAYSGGFSGANGGAPICVSPATNAWTTASGGYTLSGTNTPAVDNSVYWVTADFLKRQSVVTAGFVDVLNPHRMPERTRGTGDPRLGPFFVGTSGTPVLPSGVLPRYDWTIDPPLARLPGGTEIVTEFRAASELDPNPWAYAAFARPMRWNTSGMPPPDEVNFPLDPRKAGDAGIRKYDDRTVGQAPRESWAHFYNRVVTRYTRTISDLADDEFTNSFAGPNERFDARDVRYFNWRFVMRNNVQADPPVSPVIDSFAVTYRFERRE